jgi:ABC-type branched-subunit amino acid transport system ATPase component
MAPEERSATMALINDLAQRENLTVLFTEHDMSVVFSWAKRIAVMVMGRIIADDIPQNIRENPEVRKAYLGERA